MVEPCRTSDFASDLGSDLEQVVDTMIAVTRLSRLDGAIIAGHDSMELFSRCNGAGSSALVELDEPSKAAVAGALMQVADEDLLGAAQA